MISKETQDFISYTPKLVEFIDENKLETISSYDRIFSVLKGKFLTVKEIHEAYFNKSSKKYALTKKTIYLHLEKLVETGLIIVAGHRVSPNSKVPERIYSRAAHLFVLPSSEKEGWWRTEGGQDFGEKLNYLLSKYLNLPEVDYDEFKKFYTKLYDTSGDVLLNLLKIAENDKELETVLGKLDLEELDRLKYTIYPLSAFIRKPELFDKLLAFYNS